MNSISRHHIYISDKRYAFKEIFKKFYASQVMFAFKLLGSKHDAEDVVQEVFLSIWKSNNIFKNEIAFKAYLYMSTKNRSIDFIRKKKFKKEELDNNFFSDEEVDLIVREEAYSLLYKAIKELPPQTRRVILKSMEGLTVQETANALGISINTVKTLKLKAYRKLREMYGAGFILLLGSFLN